MLRMVAACALIGSLPAFVRAQDADPAPNETLIKMSVEARAAPKPAFRYLLLPELKEMSPGNPIQHYMKCFMEQQNFFYNKEVVEQREKWYDAPLKDLPDLKGYGGAALRGADYAARLDNLDWQVLLKLRKEGISLLLPEVQQLRMLAGALRVRFRGEVKDRRFDDALTTAKTMFAMSRHLGEHPTLIGDLVAVAIAAIAIAPLEELMQQPGCPNLYWAFAELPHPFIDLRRALQGERIFMIAEFPLLESSDPLSEAQLEKTLVKLRQLHDLIGGPQKGNQEEAVATLRARAKDEKAVEAARKGLVECGRLTAEQAKPMPAMQIILLDEMVQFEIGRDEATRWGHFPYWQVEAAYVREGKPVPGDGENPIRQPRFKNAVFASLVPTIQKVHQAQARLDQRLALLQHVEAIRLYAAEHGGQVPPTLDAIGLPLRVDPFSGKPIRYEVVGNVAHLRGTPPKGMEMNKVYNIHYEVTIK